MRRRAFTLIEVMVAVALIAVLGSLLVIGVGHLQTNSKRQQTHLIMQNLSAMFAEYDVARRVPFGMGHLNFSSMTAANQTADLDAVCMPCPGDVTSVANDRNGVAVQYTRDFMGQLLSLSNNASAVGKLSAGSLMTFASTYPTAPAWSAATTYGLYPHTPASLPSLAMDPTLTYTYLRTQIYTDTSGALLPDAPAINAPPNYYFWIPALAVASITVPLSTPVVLDAWGNPIIFVMGGVLGERPANSTVTAGFLVAGGNNFQVVSPDYRPFFASAGPDGDFSKGDDNIYSFEK